MTKKFNISTKKFLAILWLTSPFPKKDNLITIKQELENNLNAIIDSFSVKGISFGKADLICELKGKNPYIILQNLLSINKELNRLYKTDHNLCCFSNAVIANKIIFDETRSFNNRAKVVFYIFSKVHFSELSHQLIQDISKNFTNIELIEFYYSQSFHLIIKIETNDFYNTFQSLYKARFNQNLKLNNTRTFIASNLILDQNNTKPLKKHSKSNIIAFTGIEAFHQLNSSFDLDLIPVLGFFDYMTQIYGSNIEEIQEQVFDILNDVDVSNTMTILGLKKNKGD